MKPTLFFTFTLTAISGLFANTVNASSNGSDCFIAGLLPVKKTSSSNPFDQYENSKFNLVRFHPDNASATYEIFSSQEISSGIVAAAYEVETSTFDPDTGVAYINTGEIFKSTLTRVEPDGTSSIVDLDLPGFSWIQVLRFLRKDTLIGLISLFTNGREIVHLMRIDIAANTGNTEQPWKATRTSLRFMDPDNNYARGALDRHNGYLYAIRTTVNGGGLFRFAVDGSEIVQIRSAPSIEKLVVINNDGVLLGAQAEVTSTAVEISIYAINPTTGVATFRNKVSAPGGNPPYFKSDDGVIQGYLGAFVGDQETGSAYLMYNGVVWRIFGATTTEPSISTMVAENLPPLAFVGKSCSGVSSNVTFDFMTTTTTAPITTTTATPPSVTASGTSSGNGDDVTFRSESSSGVAEKDRALLMAAILLVLIKLVS